MVNIDHHAEDERFFRPISSGNLAMKYLEAAKAPLPAGVPAIVNHTDCDSILSSGMLTGLLPVVEAFGAAVIAADHTGEPNPIADLLQALDPLRDVSFSLRNLDLLMHGENLEPTAAGLLNKRLRDRARAGELVKAGRFQMIGPVAVAKLGPGERVAGEFLPSLLPDAAVIISASLMDEETWETKVRLGLAAHESDTLYSLGLWRFEPNFGGRWNAGSTRRSGGSTVDAFTLAQLIADGHSTGTGRRTSPPEPQA
jgi:hypothetical protein